MPSGEEIAVIQPSLLWMRELGTTMTANGLHNGNAVLLGAQEQLYMLDASPRARVGETVSDPNEAEFPIRLFRAATARPRVWQAPASPTSSTRMSGPSPARSTSPLREASEGGN